MLLCDAMTQCRPPGVLGRFRKEGAPVLRLQHPKGASRYKHRGHRFLKKPTHASCALRWMTIDCAHEDDRQNDSRLDM
jgi:hypothetical protein